MKVLFNEITSEDGKYYVSFTSEYGSAKAIWNGSLPTLNKEYFVEIEVYDKLYWRENVIESHDENNKILMENNNCCFIGTVESIDDDGYTVIRIGHNIICIVIEGGALPIGSSVKVIASIVELFDVKYD